MADERRDRYTSASIQMTPEALALLTARGQEQGPARSAAKVAREMIRELLAEENDDVLVERLAALRIQRPKRERVVFEIEKGDWARFRAACERAGIRPPQVVERLAALMGASGAD